MLTCPICGEKFPPDLFGHPSISALTAHVFWHLPKIFKARSNEARCCWCGKWLHSPEDLIRHMAGIDPQAHYLTRALGIKQ